MQGKCCQTLFINFIYSQKKLHICHRNGWQDSGKKAFIIEISGSAQQSPNYRFHKSSCIKYIISVAGIFDAAGT